MKMNSIAILALATAIKTSNSNTLIQDQQHQQRSYQVPHNPRNNIKTKKAKKGKRK